MSDNVENQTQGFDFNEMLPEVRRMMIDKMEPDDRCRYKGSSWFSSSEAMKSKNYLHGLEFNDFGNDSVRIHVVHGINKDGRELGYIIQFKIENQRKYAIYMDMSHKEYDRTELFDTEDLLLIAAKQFRTILKQFQKSIKKLKIFHSPNTRDCLHNFDYEVESLKQVEWLIVSFKSDIMMLTSKLQKPLRALVVHGERNNAALENYDVTTVQEYLYAPYIRLNYVQLLKLPAEKIIIHIGHLTEMDIFNYVQLWKAGKTGKRIEDYKWDLEGSDFDVQQLFSLFGKTFKGNSDSIDISHSFKKNREAMLIYEDGFLYFDNNELHWKTKSEMEDETMDDVEEGQIEVDQEQESEDENENMEE